MRDEVDSVRAAVVILSSVRDWPGTLSMDSALAHRAGPSGKYFVRCSLIVFTGR